MANRIVGNVVILDTTGNFNTGVSFKVASVAFWSTNTTGELIISHATDTSNEIIKIRNNQNQPFMLPIYLGGVYLDDINVKTLTAGTAWLYLV